MKTFNYSALIIIISILNLLMTGCHNTNLIETSVTPCGDDISQYKVVGQLNEVEGEIITLPKLFPSTSYFIKVISPIDNMVGYARLPLGACNLPDSFKREGVHIIFTGKLLQYNVSNNVSADASSQSFELTKIKATNNLNN